jgi:hypothetical protein
VLEPLTDLPEGAIGFTARGEIEASDYTEVLLPAIRDTIAAGRDVRIVLVFERWEGLSASALWQDLKLGVEHLTKWKKIALVTDVDWMIHLSTLFGWMTPGELKHFPLAARDEAIAWAAEVSSSG